MMMSDEKKYVLVKTISTFEHSYLIPLQEEMAITDHLDYVTCHEVEETSQVHVDECILPNCTKILSEDEAIELFDRENDYLRSWSRGYKLEAINNHFRPGRDIDE